MADSSLSRTQWVDIVPPESVTTALDGGVATLITIAMIALATGIYWWRRRSRQKARRVIRGIGSANALTDEQRKTGCHVIAQQLGLAFGAGRLASIRFDGSHQTKWDAFLRQLDRNRFSPLPPSAEDLAQLQEQAIHWLGRR